MIIDNSNVNIGLIGVGTMGKIILKKLLNVGYTVYAYDVSKQAKEFIKNKGAHLSQNVKEVAKKTDIFVLSLPTPKIMLEIVTKEDGIAENSKKGSILIDTSTVDPNSSINAAFITKNKGKYYLDAPLLGRPSAPDGWVSPVGGDLKIFNLSKKIIESYVTKAIYVGNQGNGSTLKLLNQLMFATINCITCEIMAICSKTKLSKKVMFETIANSGAATVSGLFKEVGFKINQDDYQPEFSLDLLAKDAKLAELMISSYNTPSFLIGNINLIISYANSKNLGNEDTSALYKAYIDFYQNRTKDKDAPIFDKAL
jgi:3-hydroxyisobutyrate dehydrogenase-like beta-hydroxyacid dehydrogenase